MLQEDYEDEEEEEGSLDTTESVLIAPPSFKDEDETEVILMEIRLDCCYHRIAT